MQLTDTTTNWAEQPIELKLPTSYKADDNAIYKVKIKKDDDKVSKKDMIVVSRVPLLATRILKNLENGTEKVEVSYLYLGHWHTITAGREIWSNNRKIIDLAGQGLPIDSEIAKGLVGYLAEMLILNADIIPVVKSINHLGWYNDKFIPYNEYVLFDSVQEFQDIYKSVEQKGDLQSWLKTILKVRENIAVRLFIDASFASVLVEPLNLLPFVTHIWGGTGTGKTVALMCAASVWGNPRPGKLTRTMNMTNNAIMSLAATLRNLPFFGDELQTIKDKYGYDKLIMQITEGINRGRMSKNGEMQDMKSWKNIFLFTGEEPCTTDGSGGGTRNRVIELECTSEIIKNGREVVEIITKNYGTAGKYFIEHLPEITRIASYFTVFQKSIDLHCETTAKQRDALALLCTADELFHEIFKTDEHELDFDTESQYNPLFCLKTDTEVDGPIRAYDWLIDYVNEHSRNFIQIDKTDKDLGFTGEGGNLPAFWGKIDTDNGTVSIIKSVLERELKNAGFSFDACKKAWKETGLLVTRSDGKYARDMRFNHRFVKCIVIKLQ